ncbi:helix-turn-helix domain-containing protein [Flavobacterium sp. LAR06]|uniref:helix-turn-helix domain-containing protein n=1 Tax=Flavobacterium sp. LAR06 TaxID=3064897 RepID=UPI0035C0E8F4
MGFEKLTSKEKHFYLAKLENILISGKLFLKNDFALPDLAKETGIQLHTISYLVNSQINLHFKDYINLKRIAYFKEKVNDPEWKDFTAEKMILASGFKSRTTGYRAFIKHVGAAPSEYLKSCRAGYERPKGTRTIF